MRTRSSRFAGIVLAVAALTVSACDADVPAPDRTREVPIAAPTVAPSPTPVPAPTTAPPTADPTTAPVQGPASSAGGTPILPVMGTLSIPEAPAGTMDVVLQGEPDSSSGLQNLPIVAQNNTGGTVYSASVRATGTAPDGSITTWVVGNLIPNTLEAGEWAFAELLLLDGVAVEGSTYTFEVTPTTVQGSLYNLGLTLTGVATQAGASEQVVGTATNETGEPAFSPFKVQVMCFDAAGTTPTGVETDYIFVDEMAVGASEDFSVKVDVECPNYAVSAEGWNF